MRRSHTPCFFMGILLGFDIEDILCLM
jgi:hypothetical protein